MNPKYTILICGVRYCKIHYHKKHVTKMPMCSKIIIVFYEVIDDPLVISLQQIFSLFYKLS